MKQEKIKNLKKKIKNAIGTQKQILPRYENGLNYWLSENKRFNLAVNKKQGLVLLNVGR